MPTISFKRRHSITYTFFIKATSLLLNYLVTFVNANPPVCRITLFSL